MDPGIFFQQKILTNFVVKDDIFGHLKKSEILECSVVSKYWNKASREYLRRRHRCILHLEPGEGFEELEKKCMIVENSVEMPFNGIHLNFGWNFEVGIGRSRKSIAKTNSEFRPTLEILGKIPVKYVSMKFVHENELWRQNRSIQCHFGNPEFLGEWMAKRHREAFLYYMKILSIECIEHLHVEGNVELHWDSLVAAAGKDRQFGNLKCAALIVSGTNAENLGGVNEFLKKSPVLTEWSKALGIEEALAFVKMNKTKAIRNIVLSSAGCERLLKQLKEVEGACLVLNKLDIDFNAEPQNVEMFKRLVRWSSSSLLEFIANREFLLALVTSDCSPFMNLQKVLPIIPHSDFKLWLNQFKENGNAKRMFPKALLDYIRLSRLF